MLGNSFQRIKPGEVSDNAFSLVGQDWMLITSGTSDKFNMMTASWGGMGFLWNKNVCFIFVRHSRYTYELMESHDHFSLSFFSEEWRKALNVCGTLSGRTHDKVKETGLTPFKGENETIAFEQARLIMECKKLYFQDLDSDHFIDESLKKFYQDQDYHRMYIGEILNVSIKP